ncbi:MAG: A/G-specific adenine glycosylase [Nitrosomonadales bacterium]|nr:A/G-specific adenine glycosylase [Nitrosomonadales bacterium]
MDTFSSHIIKWQRLHGRHDLPWQGTDAYRVWLSEIMLQQTQVATVIPYYQRFVASFPDVAALAAASEDEVLAHWSGLGYYSRARNLHAAARHIMQQHDGKFPRGFDDIIALPGIGRSTAAAISTLAFHAQRAILDGNVKRVLARYCGIEGYPGEKKIEMQLWRQAEALLPQRDAAIYTQGLMDLGATLCTRSKPRCTSCPVQSDCIALQTNRVAKLPTPRARKALPEKHAAFLLLMHGNDILLEKRPASGIWGGLWCLPQFADERAALEWCAQRGIAGDLHQALDPFTHTFTHYKLHIAPLQMELHHKPLIAAQPGSLWLDAGAALNAAIPAPVREMLRQIVTK